MRAVASSARSDAGATRIKAKAGTADIRSRRTQPNITPPHRRTPNVVIAATSTGKEGPVGIHPYRLIAANADDGTPKVGGGANSPA
jgi:hypothetical protein